MQKARTTLSIRDRGKAAAVAFFAFIVALGTTVIPATKSAPADKVTPSPATLTEGRQGGGAPVVIDGSVTPEKVPDQVAFKLVFRLVSSLLERGEEKSARAYINMLGLGRGCASCPGGNSEAEPDSDCSDGGARQGRSPEVEVMLGVVRDYQKQMYVLDGKAQAIERGDAGRRAAGFAALNRERGEMIRQRVASLQSQLAPDAFSRLKRQIDEHVKPRVKMRVRGPEQSQHVSDETAERREAQ